MVETEGELTARSDLGVVFYQDGQVGELAQPGGNSASVPSGHTAGTHNSSRGGVHRAGDGDT